MNPHSGTVQAFLHPHEIERRADAIEHDIRQTLADGDHDLHSIERLHGKVSGTANDAAKPSTSDVAEARHDH